MGTLSAKQRKKLPDSDYAIPSKRAYPIPDEAHARLALAMVSKYGSPDEKARVRAAVHRKFPKIDAGAEDAKNQKAADRRKAGKI